MSLINDALKRAKAAQDQAPPVAVPELRFRQPIPQQATKSGSPWLLILLACGMVAFAAIAFCALRKSDAALVVNASSPRKVEEKLPESASQPAPVQATAASWDNSSENSLVPVSEPAASPQNAPEAVTETTAAQKSPPAEPVQTIQPQPTEPLVAAIPPPVVPKPPEVKLQGIFYSPTRPSAMINGRTLFVGDKLGELRVVAIDQTSATLAAAGRTNVLSLAE